MACVPSDSSQLHFTAVYYSYKHLDVSFKAELHHWGQWLTGHNEGTSLSASYCISGFVLLISHRSLIGLLKSKKNQVQIKGGACEKPYRKTLSIRICLQSQPGFPSHPSVHVDPGSENPEEHGLWGILEKSLVLNLFIWTNYFNYSNSFVS